MTADKLSAGLANASFDLHDDVSTEMTIVNGSDRLVASDESINGDPNRWLSLTRLATYLNGALSLVAAVADGAVTTVKLANSAVTNAKLGTDAVTSSKIADGAVNNARLASSAVTSAKLGTNAVTSAKINDGAVATAKLANGAVTSAKLASSVLPGRVVWLHAAGGSVPATDGAEAVKIETDEFTYDGMAFDSVSDKHLDWLFPMPTDYDGGNIEWRVWWTADAGSGTVQWDFSMASPGDNGFIGTPVSIGSITDTKQTSDRIHRSSVMTQTSSKPSANEMVALRLTRDVSADTLNADATLISIRAEF